MEPRAWGDWLLIILYNTDIIVIDKVSFGIAYFDKERKIKKPEGKGKQNHLPDSIHMIQ